MWTAIRRATKWCGLMSNKAAPDPEDRLRTLAESLIRDSCEEHYVARVQKGLCRDCLHAALVRVVAEEKGGLR